MIIDDSKLHQVGTLWRVDTHPILSSSKPGEKWSVEMECGLFLNPVCITEKQEIIDKETKAETFEVELFIHAPSCVGEFIICTADMSAHGYIFLGSEIVTLNVPTKDPVEAEVEMLDKKEASLIEEHLAKLNAIQQRKKDLLCLEVKSD